VNRKKVQRLWREEGLRGPTQTSQAPAPRDFDQPADRLGATHPHHVWALDYQFDVTTQGRTLKVPHVVDEHTPESPCDLVAYSIDADATVAALERIVVERGATGRPLQPRRPAPPQIRCDRTRTSVPIGP